LRERVRVRMGTDPQPSSAGIVVDSQSVKSTGVGGEQRGDQNRRMSKDYERLTETSEAFILRGNESADGEAVGTPMRLFGQFLHALG
jgi:hypothetical protein